MPWCWGWCCGDAVMRLYITTTGNEIYQSNAALSSSSSATSVGGNSLQKIAFDSSGNVYVADGNKLFKFGPDLGTPLWEKTFTSDGSVSDVVVDSTNGWVYCTGNPISTTKTVRKFQTSDGAEITTGGWPYDLGTSTAGGKVIGWTISLDSNLDIWVGHYPSTGSGNPSLTKLDSTGSKLADYQPFQLGGTHYQWPREIAIDSNDNIYCALSSFGTVVENLVKLNSSATKQWGKAPDGTTGHAYGVAINPDEDRIAVCGDHSGGASNNDIYVYDDSGTLDFADNWGLRSNSCTFDDDGQLFVSILDTTSPHDTVLRYSTGGSQDASIDLGAAGQSVAWYSAA